MRNWILGFLISVVAILASAGILAQCTNNTSTHECETNNDCNVINCLMCDQTTFTCTSFCTGNQTCDGNAQCQNPCTPNCSGKCGGPNGCNGNCPMTCPSGQGCPAPGYNQCGACTPSCSGRCGGPDNCGASCPNTCPQGQVCPAPNYSDCSNVCVPNCSGKCGGTDGCTGTCPNNCGGGKTCQSPNYNLCVGCTPACSGKCGGDDSCGGSCPNTCPSNQTCIAPNYTNCTAPISCTSDAQCTPPSTICSTTQGICIPGCTVDTGRCTGDYACDSSSGHCHLVVPQPTANDIYFAVLGDTRPDSCNSTYPPVTGTIWGEISAKQPHQVFVGGDYVFLKDCDTAADATRQFNDFLGLQHTNYKWSGPVHYVFGNHESTQVSTYKSVMKTDLYYAIEDTAQNAKYVVIDDNDFDLSVKCQWNPTQKTWLDAELSKPTKYTFVFRHHPYTAFGLNPDPLYCSPCQTCPDINGEIIKVIDAHPLTLLIAGHDHSYYVSKRHWKDSGGYGRELVSGNGGAPLAADKPGYPPNYYGYVLVQSLPSGNIAVMAYDATTNLQTDLSWVEP